MFSLLSAASVINVENLLDRLLNYGIELGKSLLAALVIYIVGRFIIKYILRFITSLMVKRKVEVSVQTFLRSLLKIVLNLILAFAIISKLGCCHRYGSVGQSVQLCGRTDYSRLQAFQGGRLYRRSWRKWYG